MTFRTGLTIAAAAFSLTSCGGMQITEMEPKARIGASSAEAACTTAVNANMPGGRATVVSSAPSSAGTLVTLRSGDGSNWRCLTSDTGVVEELSVI